MTAINEAWEDTRAFIRREASLLAPLALATLFVADVVGTLARPTDPATQASALGTFVMLASAVWSIVGQLAITALVLKPGASVGEALALGGARLGKVLLIALLLGLGLSLMMMPVVMAIVQSGANPAQPETMRNIPGWAAIYALFLMIVMIWAGARLIFINALVVDRNPGAVAAIRTAFAMTRGMVAQIILALIVYLVVLFVLMSAIRGVAGSAFALVGAAVGSAFTGNVLSAIVAGLVATALSAVAAVFVASLYACRSQANTRSDLDATFR